MLDVALGSARALACRGWRPRRPHARSAKLPRLNEQFPRQLLDEPFHFKT